MSDLTAKREITCDEALELLRANQPIQDKIVVGQIDLVKFGDDADNFSVIIDNSKIEGLFAQTINFKKQVVIRNSHIEKCDFGFAYFTGGLLITNSVFYSDLDFQCGGHNKQENKIELTDNDFRGFANFFDCIYNGPVIVKRNKFKLGTNLFGNKGKFWQPQFDSFIVNEDNEGEINLTDE
jgi:hypothetical protein